MGIIDGRAPITSISATQSIPTNQTVEGQAGETLAQYDVVYPKPSDGKWYKALCNGTPEQGNGWGIVLEYGGITSGDTGTIQIGQGWIENAGWSFTHLSELWVSTTAGAMAQSQPTTPGHIAKPLGIVETATKIFWNPGTGYIVPVEQFTKRSFSIDGGGGVAITTGYKGWDSGAPVGTIVAWYLEADQSGSIELDIWKSTRANYPPDVGDTICNGHYPALSSALTASDTDLGDWSSVALDTDCVLGWNVRSASTVTKVVCTLKVLV